MSKKTRFVGLLLLTQTACIAAGVWLQHYCLRWSARDAILKQRLSAMAGKADALVSRLDPQGGIPLISDDWAQNGQNGLPAVSEVQSDRRVMILDKLAEAMSALATPDTALMLVDRQWKVRFSANLPSSPVSGAVDGDQLQWMPLNHAGFFRDDEAFGVLRLSDGAHFAVARSLPESGGYLVLHQPEAALEQEVSGVLGNQAVVSLVTLVWTGAMLGFCGFLFAGRFIGETEREAMRSLNDALRQRRDLIRTRDAVIVGLAKLAESRDPETGDHLDRISVYATTLATTMMRDPEFMVEVTPSFVRLIGISATLHDIGKVGVEDRILLKPAKLTEAERTRMEDHSRIGGECLREIERRLGRSNFLQMAREIAFSHHECWDGSGYPARLSGERIPLAARIVAVCDVYDALSSRRVYKEPLAHDKCVAIIREAAGTQFDPRIVELWLPIAKKFRDIAERYSSSHISAFNDCPEEKAADAIVVHGSTAPVEAMVSELRVVGN